MKEKPFLIEIRQERLRPNGTFEPAASLKVTEALRTSGLLQELTPDDLKNMVYLLTFLSPEGHCSVSLPILASAIGASSRQVQDRMHKLAQFRFMNMGVITETKHESGLCTYSLNPHLVAYEHLTISEPHSTSPIRVSSRQQVIDNSRKQYATPRAEVERMVAEQLEHDPTETDEQRKLRFRLENVGLNTDQAKEVLSNHSIDAIAQQLKWLPYRNAKNPAGYLLAAIDGDYSEPRSLKYQRQTVEDKTVDEDTVSENVTPEDELNQEMQLEIDGPPLSLPLEE